MVNLHDTEELLGASGLSLRRVQRAQQRGELKPSSQGGGRGKKTAWTPAEMVAADVYRDLTDAGMMPGATRPILDAIDSLDGFKGNPEKNRDGLIYLHTDYFPAFLFCANGQVLAHDEHPTPERLLVLRSGVYIVVDVHMYVARLALYFDLRAVEPSERFKRLCSHATTSPAFGRAVYALVREATEDGGERLIAFLGVKPKSAAGKAAKEAVKALDESFNALRKAHGETA